MIFFTLIPLITILFTVSKKQHLNQEKITVYAVKGHTSIDFITGNKHILLADSNLLNDLQLQSFYLEGNWIDHGLKKPIMIDINNDTTIIEKGIVFKKHGAFIYFNGTRTMIFNDRPPGSCLLHRQDLFIIMRVKDILAIQNIKSSGPIILDGNLPGYQKRRIKESFSKESLKFWDVLEQGAYNIDLTKQ